LLICTTHKLGHCQRRFAPDSIDVSVVNFVAVGCGIVSARNWVQRCWNTPWHFLNWPV